jgi:hypothetical protein
MFEEAQRQLGWEAGRRGAGCVVHAQNVVGWAPESGGGDACPSGQKWEWELGRSKMPLRASRRRSACANYCRPGI